MHVEADRLDALIRIDGLTGQLQDQGVARGGSDAPIDAFPSDSSTRVPLKTSSLPPEQTEGRL